MALITFAWTVSPGKSRNHISSAQDEEHVCLWFVRVLLSPHWRWGQGHLQSPLSLCVFLSFLSPPVPLCLLLLLCPLGPPSPLSTLATAPAPNPGHPPARSLSALFFCSCTSSHSPPLSSASCYSPVVLIPSLQFPSMMTSDFLRAGRTPAHWVCPSACRCWAGLIPSVQNSFIRATNTIQAPSWWETREAFLPLSLTWPRPQAGP